MRWDHSFLTVVGQRLQQLACGPARCAAGRTHWMLLDSLKFRAGQERITLLEADGEEQGHAEE